MLYTMSGPEVLALLVIVLIIFAAARFSKMNRELRLGHHPLRESLVGGPGPAPEQDKP
jgi:Sec-independent protein translocase protein TatA